MKIVNHDPCCSRQASLPLVHGLSKDIGITHIQTSIMANATILYLQMWQSNMFRECTARAKDSMNTLHFSMNLYSEKSPARPMLFYSTNNWQQFWVLFVV